MVPRIKRIRMMASMKTPIRRGRNRKHIARQGKHLPEQKKTRQRVNVDVDSIWNKMTSDTAQIGTKATIRSHLTMRLQALLK
jgi:hypothetical protein